MLLIIAALNFTLYAFTWSIPPVRGSRFMLLSYCMLLPFSVWRIGFMLNGTRRISKYGAALLIGTVGVIYIWGCVSTDSYRRTEFRPLTRTAVQSIRNDSPFGSNLASNNPWIVGYSTGQPTALLPRNLRAPELTRFLAEYKIGAIVILGKKPDSVTLRTIRDNPTEYKLVKLGPTVRMASTHYGLVARTRARTHTKASGI